MTGNPFKAATDWMKFDARRRTAQATQETALARMEPEPGVRAMSARVIERELWGEPTSQHHSTSPVLGLPMTAMFWERPNVRTVSVRQFRVPINGYD